MNCILLPCCYMNQEHICDKHLIKIHLRFIPRVCMFGGRKNQMLVLLTLTSKNSFKFINISVTSILTYQFWKKVYINVSTLF